MHNTRIIYFILFFPLIVISSEWNKTIGRYAEVEYLAQHREIADSILNIADRVLPELAANHGYEINKYTENKCRIIFTDAPDISNGFAVGNTIVIYGTSSAYLSGWTGRKNWYELVVKHELAHHVTVRVLQRKASFLGLITLASVPRWFFEGIAQYFAEDWTLTRGDIYLQNAVLQGKLDYNTLTNLNDGRLLYASAHGFVRFLADQYGDSSLIKLMAYNKDGWFYGFEKAFKATYKKSVKALFPDFVKHSTLYYGSKLAQYPVNKFAEIASFTALNLQLVPFNNSDSFLISGVEKSSQFYRTAWIAQKDSNAKLVQLKKVLTHFSGDLFVSPDDQLLAYAQADYSVSDNLNSIKFDWYVKNINSGTKTGILKKVRARFAAFDSKNYLYLSIVNSNKSLLIKYNPNNGLTDTLLTSDYVLGRIQIDTKDNIFVEAQKKDGYRTIFKIESGVFLPVSDLDALTNLHFLNGNKAIVNRIEDQLPVIYRIDLETGKYEKILADRDPLFIEAFNKKSNELILSGLDYDRSRKFFSINLDTLLQKNNTISKTSINPYYSSWTEKNSPKLNSQSSKFVPKKNKKILFHHGNLEHAFSFAWPVFDKHAGSGLFATTTWFDPLQRHAINFSGLGFFEKSDESVLAYTHLLKAFDQNFLFTAYHGPVIFSYDKNSYEKLYNTILSAGINHSRFAAGNINYPFSLNITFNYSSYFNSDIFKSYSFYGPQIGFSWKSRLLTEYRNFLPEKLFKISSRYFKSLKNDYDFSVFQNDVVLAKSLFTPEIGISVTANYTKTYGETPPLQVTGIDRLYEFDIPRDVRYTKTVRGINKDIFGEELIYGQVELSWLLAKRTTFKLIFFPMNYPLLTGFFDFAEISANDKIRAYSYGVETSFGAYFLRFAGGYALSKHEYYSKDEHFYFRIKLIFPEL